MKPFLFLIAGTLVCGAVMQAQSGAPQAQSGAPQAQSGAPQAQTDAPQAQTGAPQAQTGAPQVTKFAPLDYFNDKCAKCHGAYGSFYGKEFATGKSDEELADTVKQMCEGPAQAPLSPHDLNVLVAWHRSLRDGKPFVASVKLEGGVWSGEATPGSTVVMETSTGARTEAPLKEHRWSAGMPEGVRITKVQVKNGEQVVEFDPRLGAYAPK